MLPQITTVEIGLDVLSGSDLLAWRQDMQLASAAPGGAAAATTTQAKPPPTHDTDTNRVGPDSILESEPDPD